MRTKLAVVALAASFLAFSPAASAVENDVVIYKSPSQPPHTPAEYRKLITELGLLISGKTLSPANTLGVNGFDVGVEVTTGLIHGQEPYWTKAAKDGSVPRVFSYPTLRVRKGLPFSIEGGMTVSYLPFTQQQVLGGQARFALHEGFSLVPDVSVQLGYDEYVGNEQLEMSVKSGIATMGYTWAFGELPGVKTGRLSAWGGYGKVQIDSQVNRRGLGSLTPLEKDAFLNAIGTDNSGNLQIRADKWVTGVQIESGKFAFLVNGEFVDSAIPTVNLRWGAQF